MHVLYAPTWRPYANVDLLSFPDLDLSALSKFLTDHQIHLWLRVHPKFEQSIAPALLACPNVHLFGSAAYPEANLYMNYFSALITDYSSIFYDFLVLERPVLFLDYDFEQYNKVVGVIDRYEQVKCSPTISTQNPPYS